MIKVISHSSLLIVLAVFVQIDDVAVQGPDKGDVQRQVVRRGALHQGVLTRFNVDVGWGQADLCRLWGQKSDDESSDDRGFNKGDKATTVQLSQMATRGQKRAMFQNTRLTIKNK